MEYCQKSIHPTQAQIKFHPDTGHFEGYASVFNGNDCYDDTILPGAFSQVLQAQPNIKMFYNHHREGLPIGKWLSLQEDAIGLYVKGELTPGNREAENLKAAIQHGTVDGLSIGYRIQPADFFTKTEGGRIIHNISELEEISIVNFPADRAAKLTVISIKSAIQYSHEIKSIFKKYSLPTFHP
jgi:HK97 family phage prohead protease